MRGSEIPVEDFLANLPLFSDLDRAEIARVAAGTRRIHAARGERLFTRGDRCEGFFVVLYGQVKLFATSPQGAEKVIDIVGPGLSFGEAIMFTDTPFVVSAQALADSLLLHVSKAVVYEELEKDPRFARKMIAGLARKLHQLVRDVEAYSLRSAVERVIGVLLEQVPAEAGERAKVTLAATRTVIASRLNLTPEYLSRILHDLAQAGIIEMDGREVTILDVNRLRSYPD